MRRLRGAQVEGLARREEGVGGEGVVGGEAAEGVEVGGGAVFEGEAGV